MNETDYHRLADRCLNELFTQLDKADQSGALDAEYQNGVITLTLPSGKQYIISKHTASRQIWLSSPVSGGLHFSYKEGEWQLPDGRTLSSVLSQELPLLGS